MKQLLDAQKEHIAKLEKLYLGACEQLKKQSIRCEARLAKMSDTCTKLRDLLDKKQLEVKEFEECWEARDKELRDAYDQAEMISYLNPETKNISRTRIGDKCLAKDEGGNVWQKAILIGYRKEVVDGPFVCVTEAPEGEYIEVFNHIKPHITKTRIGGEEE